MAAAAAPTFAIVRVPSPSDFDAIVNAEVKRVANMAPGANVFVLVSGDVDPVSHESWCSDCRKGLLRELFIGMCCILLCFLQPSLSFTSFSRVSKMLFWSRRSWQGVITRATLNIPIVCTST